MSITRLQQARQMYAMGQRVGRIAFGGGGSYVTESGSGQYQGGSAAPGSAEAAPGGGGSSYSSPSDHNEKYGNTNTATDPGGYVSDKNPTGTLTGKDYQKAEEKYLAGVGQSQLQHLYDTGVSTINPPFGLPSAFTLGLNVLKPVRDFSLKKNIDYFKGLSQTEYPQTLQGYKDYMKDRLGGKITASGNTHPNYMTDSQGNYILRDGGDGGGITDINIDVDDTTTDDTTTDVDFFSRYLQNQPDDIREEIEAKMKNYYTV